MGVLPWKILCAKLAKSPRLSKTKAAGSTPARSILFVGGGLDIRQRRDEIPEDLGRHHDRVTIPADVFGDLHHHAARVLFEIEIKGLPIREDFFRM
jgi:hypothetical protein